MTIVGLFLLYVVGGLFTARWVKFWMENQVDDPDPWRQRHYEDSYTNYYSSPMRKRYSSPVQMIVYPALFWPAFLTGVILFIVGRHAVRALTPGVKLFFENPKHRKARKHQLTKRVAA